MNYIKFIFSAMILAALLFSGCKKTDTTTNPPPTTTTAHGTYTGVLAGSTSSGVMSLNIPTSSAFAKSTSSQASISVTGTVILGSDTITVAGTYNTSDDSLYVSGSLNSETFSFAGTYNSSTGALSGSWTDSNGDSGDFAAAAGTGAAVKVFLGAAVSTTHPGNSAQLDLAISGSSILGVASIGSQRQFFTGTLSGTSITLTYTISGLHTTIGTGTLNTSNTPPTAAGTYSITSVDSGSWSVTEIN